MLLSDSVKELVEQGCAVIIWTPEELQGADPRRVEERSIEFGYEVIEHYSKYSAAMGETDEE